MATRRALLLIADIGGYTEYMQFHRSILGHAEAATTRMLDKVVDAARDFDLIEIEGARATRPFSRATPTGWTALRRSPPSPGRPSPCTVRFSRLAFLARVRGPPRSDTLEFGEPADADVAVGDAGLDLVGEILPHGV
ncbi:MAG: uncharacterized protein K0R88_1946 [Solirubrobacterales bacterium]|nr:uncharacterized protein [Solirubrobacterales bacterium]